ncbi:MAG: hypothetical protein ACRDOK_18075 [Streptosporangiaceae bacterium]
MAATTRQPVGQAERRWVLLLRPRWLAWHAFAVLAAAGMLYLGRWQLHRAESGNELSWAYTFEWPLFAAFGGYFWFKSLRDEMREHGAAGAESEPDAAEPGAAVAADAISGARVRGPVGATGTARAGRKAASWDATSWDATSWDATGWDATGGEAGADSAGQAVDPARATPADGEAYVARLTAEVQRSGRRRGWR